MQLFHYHVLTRGVREREEHYRRLGFRLVARYGTLGGEQVAAGPAQGWDELDAGGFRHRLTELERGGLNVVVQPGRTEEPLVDHIGVLLTPPEQERVLERASAAGLRVQDRGGRRTFVATGAGFRLELRTDAPPPATPWEVTLATADPGHATGALAALVGPPVSDGAVTLGRGCVRFVAGGPEGRPQLVAERVGAAA
ncbi:MAG TPA: hypothetical protein VH950_03445 [Gaiellaceae bacterium]